jgi:general secretion pathway protein N
MRCAALIVKAVLANAVLLPCCSAAAFAADAAASRSLAADAAALAPNQRDGLPNPVAAQTMEGLSATVDRPLFSPSRRAPAPPVPAAEAPALPPPPAPPPNVVLVGIVMDGESARAVIRAGADKKIMRARIGDDVGGWKVAQIEGRKLVLSLDDRLATFTLFNNRAGEPRAINEAAAPNLLGRTENPLPQSGPGQNSAAANSDANNSRKRRHRRD